jgi:ABC-2 type transport system ATP-binding protein
VLKVDFQSDGETLLFETNNRERFFSLLPPKVIQKDLIVKEITSPDDNLQAVFDYLVGK